MSFRTSRQVVLGSLLTAIASFVALPAQADVPAGGSECNKAAGTCASGTTALSGKIQTKLASEIDSGWLEKGKIKIRTHFTIDPVKGEPLLSVDMPKGALVNATWSAAEKGAITIRPITEQGASGTVNIHYTLTPALEANIYGTAINYDTTTLLQKIPGAEINYDAKVATTLSPWGFAGAEATPAPPSLDSSTIFSLSFETLGIDPGLVEGSLSIQAAAKPTFKYLTKEIMFDSASVTAADGSAKINVADGDFVDVNATVMGELAVAGILDIRPVIKVDTVDGFPTFGLVKYSFSAVSKEFGGAPTPVSFERTTIHVPLPNVKVPNAPVGVGDAKAGDELSKKVTINSTGEMDAVLKFESSDPQFIVPSGDVPVKSKSTYDLDVKFKPSSDGPASATITVRSNDPDSPEQTFRVAANGASLEPEDANDPGSSGKKKSSAEPDAKDGCACSSVGSSSSSSTSGVGALALVGLGLVLGARRRRSS